MKQKLLNSFKLRAVMLVAILCAGFTSAWGTDEVYKTLSFPDDNSANNKLSAYDQTWTAVIGSDSWEIGNFNNNSWNSSWSYIKCGRKNNASVATITTGAAIDKAITKVVVTIDAITASKINSIKLSTSNNGSSWTEAGSFSKAIGAQTVTLSSPTANLYYKLEFDCASGSSNGLVTVSKVEYYYDNAGGTPSGPTVSFGSHTNVTLSMKDGDDNSLSSGASVAAGTTVKVYATADDGYKVTSVSAVDADNAAVTLTPNTGYWSFTMPSKNVTISATAEAKTDPELAFSPATAEATLDQTFTAPTLTNTYNVSPISWSSDDAGVATVAQDGTVTLVGEGTATITASFAGNDNYNSSSASYTLTVTDPSAIDIWSEDFSSYSADDVPSGGTYTYACTGSTKVYGDVLAGGTTPELLVAKNNNTFTAVVPLNNATGTLTLTYKTNAKAMSVSTTTDGISGGGSFNTAETHTVTFTGVTTSMTSITIVFTATSGDNVRLDDIVLRGHAQAVLVEAPTFSVVGGTYYTAQSVELSCATDGATIYYSTDGEAYSPYTSAIPVSATTTIYAKAEKDGNWSTVSSSTYTIAEKNDVVFNIENKTLAIDESYTVTFGTNSGRDVQSDGYVSLSSDNAVVTIDNTKVTAAAVGTATITITVAEGATYQAGTTTFTVTVPAPEGQTTAPTTTLFNETFNKCEGTGGKDGTYSGNVGTSATTNKLDETWSVIGNNGAHECIKLGTGSAAGTVTTGDISLTGNGTLTFSAAGWSTGTNNVTITATGATLSGNTEVTLTNGEWTNYTVDIENATGTISISFEMKRGFLDDVKVIDNSAADPTIAYTIPSSGLGTFCSEYPLDLANLPDGVKAYAVTAQSTDKVTLTELTEAVKGGVGIIIEGTGGATIQIPSVDSSNVPSNQLVGTLAPTYLAANTAYGLKSGIFQPNTAGNIPAHRAYLPNPTGSVKALVLEFNEVTGISHTRAITDDATIYDLTGRRAEKATKGIYIINGKKVLVK